MKWLGLATAGALATTGFFDDGEFSFLEVLIIVAIPPLISLYSELKVARINAAATVLISKIEGGAEDE
jgi:hypothetical protein